MAEVIRILKKAGAKNREINASIREVMEVIKQNRLKKKAEQDAARQRKKDSQTSDVGNTD